MSESERECFRTECGPEEKFWVFTWQANDMKSKEFSQISEVQVAKEMFKPQNGSKLHHLKGLCVLNQWKLSM